jgi:plastocyanin
MLHKSKAFGRATLIALVVSSLAFPAYAAETMVDQLNLKFVPDTVTINAGDTIRFTNSDRFFHNVTIVNPDGTTEDKGLQNYKQEIVVTFAKVGNYQIRCRLHPAMKIAVTVK